MTKRSRHSALWLALWLAALFTAGCSMAFVSPRQAETKRAIAQAEHLAGRGDYRAAAARYEQALQAPAPNPWQDKVLFNLGCLQATADNPDRDFAKSLACFRRLSDEHPKSRFNAQGRVWLGLLEKLVALESELKTCRVELKTCRAEWTESRRLFEQESARLEAESQEREAAWSAEIGLQAKKIKELEGLVESQKAALESLKQQFDKMKEIDIQAEKKSEGIK